MGKSQFSEHDKVFYSDGYKLGLLAVEEGLDDVSLLQAIKILFTEADMLIDSLLNYARSQQVLIDCKKGCAWCCFQPIFAVSHEIHYLAGHIKKHFSKEQIKVVIGKARKKNNIIEKLAEKEVLNYKSACPLLKDGACMAYEARPMACRIYLSMDVNSCKAFYDNPEQEDSIVKLLEFPLKAGRMMNEGFKAALKSGGRESTEFRLEHGLLVGLEN